MQKKNKKILKITVIAIIIIILLLLLILLKNLVNSQDRNKLALYENTPEMLIGSEPNTPKLSAGMIPVKWNGENFVITTKTDKEWYNTQPTYVMLNDGYYKSELERGIKEEQLASRSVGATIGRPEDCGTIFMWVPRFVYNTEGEIGYIKEETTPGENWTLPELFTYKVAYETKPDFSLTGVWLQKDVDTSYSSKITQMNQEESIYGFIANTKATQITSNDTTALQKYVGAGPVSALTDPTNLNRIILKTINQNFHEPIKANIKYNTVDKKIEIRVTYTANGISKILDEYGNTMTLTEENGIIYTDTGSVGLAKGTYYFTVVDNKGNKKELSITPNVDSLFKVAYISGTDNIDNAETYTKTQEAKTTGEDTLINQLTATDTSKTYSRAITDLNNAITAITEEERADVDEQLYVYSKYNINIKNTYSWNYSRRTTTTISRNSAYAYREMTTDSSKGTIKFSDYGSYTKGGRYIQSGSGYGVYSENNGKIVITYYARVTNTTYSQSYFNSYVVDKDGTYTIGSSSQVDSDGYWYVQNSLAPKYTLYKYDQNLSLKSTYDVDTKVLTTEPIDISNKEKNKVKLNLNVTGNDYKTYISNDNTNWQEVTDTTSGTPKELELNGWDKLYIKIETNSSTINNIDVAYYKD